jgi:hypothetical protein
MEWFTRFGMEQCLDRIQSDKEQTVQPTTECLIGFSDLPDEIGQEASTLRGDFEEAAHVVFNKDRKCPKWQPYSRGKPIQQYYAESFMQELEELRQGFQEDREKERQAFEERSQLALTSRNEELQTQRDQAQTRNATLVARITVVGLIFALAQVLTLTKDSLLWKLIAGCYHWLSGH